MVKVTAGPTLHSAPPPAQEHPATPPKKTTMPAIGVLTTHCLAVLLLGGMGPVLVWCSPRAGSNGFPPVLELVYGTFCDRSACGTLVPPAISLLRLGPNPNSRI